MLIPTKKPSFLAGLVYRSTEHCVADGSVLPDVDCRPFAKRLMNVLLGLYRRRNPSGMDASRALLRGIATHRGIEWLDGKAELLTFSRRRSDNRIIENRKKGSVFETLLFPFYFLLTLDRKPGLIGFVLGIELRPTRHPSVVLVGEGSDIGHLIETVGNQRIGKRSVGAAAIESGTVVRIGFAGCWVGRVSDRRSHRNTCSKSI